MKNLNIESLPTVVAAVSASLPKSASPIEKGKALAAKLPPVVKPVSPPQVRDVVEFGKRAKLIAKPVAEQTDYESRKYMRPFRIEKPDLNAVTHLTSHTTSMIYEKAVEYMQKLYQQREPKNTMFNTGQLSEAINTYGPARTDILRNAMKKLEKEGKVKIHPEVHGKTVRYTFELLELPKTA